MIMALWNNRDSFVVRSKTFFLRPCLNRKPRTAEAFEVPSASHGSAGFSDRMTVMADITNRKQW